MDLTKASRSQAGSLSDSAGTTAETVGPKQAVKGAWEACFGHYPSDELPGWYVVGHLVTSWNDKRIPKRIGRAALCQIIGEFKYPNPEARELLVPMAMEILKRYCSVDFDIPDEDIAKMLKRYYETGII